MAVGIVLSEDSVLVGRRTRAPYAGYAEFPGGKVRPGESREEAVLREVREECGLEARVERLLARARAAPAGRTLDLHFFLCHLASQVPGAELPPPSAPFGWVPVQALSTLRFPPANAGALRALTAARKAAKL